MSKIKSYLLDAKLRLKERFINKFLVAQDKRWVRIIDASSAVICFISAAIALYLLQTLPAGKLPLVSNLVTWGYLITSLPLALILYRESDLRKVERHALVFFVLFSSMSLLLLIMAAFVNT